MILMFWLNKNNGLHWHQIIEKVNLSCTDFSCHKEKDTVIASAHAIFVPLPFNLNTPLRLVALLTVYFVLL